MDEKVIFLIILVLWFMVMAIEDWNPHEPPKDENDGLPHV